MHWKNQFKGENIVAYWKMCDCSGREGGHRRMLNASGQKFGNHCSTGFFLFCIITLFIKKLTSSLDRPYPVFLLTLSACLTQKFLQLHQSVSQCVHLIHQVCLLIVQLSVGHHGLTVLLLHLYQGVLRVDN